MSEALGLSVINEYFKVKNDYVEGQIDPLVSSMMKPIAGSLLVTGGFVLSLGLMSSHAQTVDATTSLTYVICLRSNQYVQDEVGNELQINPEL